MVYIVLMIKKSILISLVISSLIIISALFIAEHKYTRFVSKLLTDTEKTIVGITDIKSYDHGIGNRKSDVTLIEYSDYTCFFCGKTREFLNRLAIEDNIHLVYRHFYPHRDESAIKRAIAAECVALEVGEANFWDYTNFLYTNQSKINQEALKIKAISYGIDPVKFERCIRDEDERIRGKVISETKEAERIGARGTPFIVFVYKDEVVGFTYGQTYETIKERLVRSLRNKVE